MMYPMHRTHIQTVFFFALLLGVLSVAFFMFLPYLTTLAVAATLAVVSYPLHCRLIRLVRGREFISAFLSLLCVGFLLLVPLSFVGTQIYLEAQSLYLRIAENRDTLTDSIIGFLDGYIQRFAPYLSIDLENYIGQGLSFLVGKLGPFFAGTAQTVLHFFLGAIALYYFLKDGPKFLRSIVALSPLPDMEDEDVLRRLGAAINSIIRGSLIIAIIQGVMTGIGLTIFGVPSPTLWGSVAAIGALIPGVGTAIILAPAILFLFLAGKTAAAIGLLIWGIVAVGFIDNFLGPVLVGRGIKIHLLFILFAVIGGLGFFGPVGFLLGPMVLSLLYALLVTNRLPLKKSTRVG